MRKMEMKQEVAQQLFFKGATCFCLNMPHESEFGIDMKTYLTGEKFQGVKMIPPGLHFVYYRAENMQGEHLPRVGFFHNFKKEEIIVKKWDATKQELIDEENTEVISRLKMNLKSMDPYLGPYPYEIWEKWKNLSSYISPTLLNKTVPLCGKIHSVLELKAVQTEKIEGNKDLKSCRRKSKLFLCDEEADDFLPKLEAADGTELRFSKIPDKCYPDNSTPDEITKHNLDSSYLFQQLLTQHEDGQDILGEIQIAFVCFLIGLSLEAFEHWKKLFGIVCSCDEAISKYLDIFSRFITVANFQIHEIPEDFMVDIVLGNNFVYKSLRVFFRNIQSSDINGRLKSKAKRFQELLTEKLQWDFSDVLEEDEEDLPVIVDL